MNFAALNIPNIEYIAGNADQDKYKRWLDIRHRLQQLKIQIKQPESVLAFAFIEVGQNMVIFSFPMLNMIITLNQF